MSGTVLDYQARANRYRPQDAESVARTCRCLANQGMTPHDIAQALRPRPGSSSIGAHGRVQRVGYERKRRAGSGEMTAISRSALALARAGETTPTRLPGKISGRFARHVHETAAGPAKCAGICWRPTDSQSVGGQLRISPGAA